MVYTKQITVIGKPSFWVTKPIALGEADGTATLTQGDQTLSSTASVLITGNATLTQANQTLSASAGVIVTGNAAIQAADQALSASGGVTISAFAALVEQSQILVATGTVPTPPISGNFNEAQQDFALSATATATQPPPRPGFMPGFEWQRFDADPTAKVGWR